MSPFLGPESDYCVRTPLSSQSDPHPLSFPFLSPPDYIGARDANCGYPGILSFVRLALSLSNVTKLDSLDTVQLPQ